MIQNGAEQSMWAMLADQTKSAMKNLAAANTNESFAVSKFICNV